MTRRVRFLLSACILCGCSETAKRFAEPDSGIDAGRGADAGTDKDARVIEQDSDIDADRDADADTGSPEDRNAVDASTLLRKHLFGYQGWHGCPGDGSKVERWLHWSVDDKILPGKGNIRSDLWPDLSELGANELFATNLTFPDGSKAGVYSSFTKKTVVRHFKWMRDAGIDGVLLQRFLSSVQNIAERNVRDGVARNVKTGAEQYGRVFAMEYDISGANKTEFITQLKEDWVYLVDSLELTASPRYLRHNGKPVLAVWGFGFGGRRPGTPEQTQEMIRWWTQDAPKKYRVTLIGGVPTDWRSAEGRWADTYAMFDVISPWTVGRYRNETGANEYRKNFLEADVRKAAEIGVLYLPVIFPGFSWSNWNDKLESKSSRIARNGGRFYWRQAFNAVDAGATLVKTAMFDEIDEGTAMYKLATDKSKVPVEEEFLPLDVDGYALPSDFYLRLGAQVDRMLNGEIPVSEDLPINR